MDVIFIINEHAGGGKGRAVWESVKRELTIPYKSFFTTYAGHASQISREIVEYMNFEPIQLQDDQQALSMSKLQQNDVLIIAIGGDGTVHEVIEGAAGYAHVQIGAIKAGSGNDFARGYAVFTGAAPIEQFIKDKRMNTDKKDLGQIHINGEKQQSFVNNAGIGFDAYITTTVNHSKLKSWLNRMKLGSLSYMLVTIWAIFTFKRFNASLECEGNKYEFQDVWFISICNQPYFGGGMKISPRSRSNDGKLEVVVVHQLSRLKLLLVFVTVFWGKHERFKEVTILPSNQFTIKLDMPTSCHVDGEGLGTVSSDSEISCTLDPRKWTLAQSQ